MLHIFDMSRDLRRRNVSGIEAAFLALVGFPHEDTIDGAPDDVDEPVDLLTSVAEALKADTSTLPSEVIDEIAECRMGRVSYAVAAAIVAENVDLLARPVR